MLQMRERELLMRVVDEGAQVALFLLGELVAEDIVHVLAHHARAGVEDMQERLVFTVQVAHEMLGALGQVEECLQVDDLGEHRVNTDCCVGKCSESRRRYLRDWSARAIMTLRLLSAGRQTRVFRLPRPTNPPPGANR